MLCVHAFIMSTRTWRQRALLHMHHVNLSVSLLNLSNSAKVSLCIRVSLFPCVYRDWEWALCFLLWNKIYSNEFLLPAMLCNRESTKHTHKHTHTHTEKKKEEKKKEGFFLFYILSFYFFIVFLPSFSLSLSLFSLPFHLSLSPCLSPALLCFFASLLPSLLPCFFPSLSSILHSSFFLSGRKCYILCVWA